MEGRGTKALIDEFIRSVHVFVAAADRAACPSGSIRRRLFEDEEIFEEIEGILAYA